METQPTDEQMQRFFRYALRYAMRWHKHPDDALQSEEYSDACWGIHRALLTYDGSRGANLDTWVTTNIMGYGNDGMRKRGKFQRNGLNRTGFFDPGADDPTPMLERLDTVELKHLRECLAELLPSEREIVGQVFEYTQPEIAQMRGCSVENVRRLWKNAVRKLRKAMTARGYTIDAVDLRGCRYHRL